jgi:very-short-patch-repair endonuclease
LVANGIEHEREKSFDTCRDIKVLPFDFWVTGQPVLIEYDGKHHYEPIDYFGGEESFAKTQKHDRIKNAWAESNGYRLIRIPYWEKSNIGDVLGSQLMPILRSCAKL